MPTCVWKDCINIVPEGHGFIDGQSHCLGHYEMRITQNFQDSYKSWASEALPERFLYNWSRYVIKVVYRGQSMPSMLSRARLRDRTFNHMKKDDGLVFSIIRHPGAFKEGVVSIEVQQDWRFKISIGELILEDEV